jgi:hypothetical protein
MFLVSPVDLSIFGFNHVRPWCRVSFDYFGGCFSPNEIGVRILRLNSLSADDGRFSAGVLLTISNASSMTVLSSLQFLEQVLLNF